MLVYVPDGRGAALIATLWSPNSAVSPKACPALKAALFAETTKSFPANFSSIHSKVGSTGRLYIHETSPKAKKFFERSASLGFTPRSLQASFVKLVIGTLITR